MDAQRAKFEQTMKALGYSDEVFRRFEDGTYCHPSAVGGWAAWKAAQAQEIPQPIIGAITLLETIAEYGAIAKHEDNTETPNAELCKKFAASLKAFSQHQDRHIEQLKAANAGLETLLDTALSERNALLDAQRTKLIEMGEQPISEWYFSCDVHYIDVERDKDGKYSVFFKNGADKSEAWYDQADTVDALLSPANLQAAAKAVEDSAVIWAGFSMLDAKTCITAALEDMRKETK